MPTKTEQDKWIDTFLDRKFRARRADMDAKSQDITESQQRQIVLAGGIMNLLTRLKPLSEQVEENKSNI